MQRIETILRGVPWRRVPWRLYKALLPAPLRRWIARVLSLRLPGLGGLGVGRLARLAIKDFFVDDMATYGAALAFHLLLALFPLLLGAEVNGVIYHHALQSHTTARAAAHTTDAPRLGRKPVA